jgi:hypothetical protein
MHTGDGWNLLVLYYKDPVVGFGQARGVASGLSGW